MRCPPPNPPFARGGKYWRKRMLSPPCEGGVGGVVGARRTSLFRRMGGWSGQDEPADVRAAGRAAKRARKLVSLLSTVAHGAAVATWQGIVLARRFPRASLASGLSIAILAAVMVLKPGKGEHDTTVQIGTKPPSQADPDPGKPAAPPPAPAVAASLTDKAKKDESHDKPHDSTGKTHPTSLADKQAQPAPGPEADPLAPAPLPAVESVKLTAGEGDLLPLPTSSPDPQEQGSQASQPAATSAANAPAPAPAPALAPCSSSPVRR